MPYSEIKKQDDIRYKVLSGERPEIPECVFETENEMKYYEHYTALITRGWQHEANARPSITEMLSELECIWMSVCSGVLLDTDVCPEVSEIYDDVRGRRQSRFSMWSTLTPGSSPFVPHSSIIRGNDAVANSVNETMTLKICDLMNGDKESFAAIDNHPGKSVGGKCILCVYLRQPFEQSENMICRGFMSLLYPSKDS